MVKLNKYDSLFWTEYKEQMQLTVGWVDREGVSKPTWIQREFGKDKWKKVPFTIAFESRMAAIEALEILVEELKDEGSPF